MGRASAEDPEDAESAERRKERNKKEAFPALLYAPHPPAYFHILFSALRPLRFVPLAMVERDGGEGFGAADAGAEGAGAAERAARLA